MKTIIQVWRDGKLQKQRTFLELLGDFSEKESVISVVGAGGKTTTIRRIAQELMEKEISPIVTTTTHIEKEETTFFLTNPSFEEIQDVLKMEGQVWFGNSTNREGKVGSPSFELLESVWRSRKGVLLIEADGARRMPCKVPAAHEPVIFERTTHVLSVYGLDAIGKAIEESCFRPELVAEILGKQKTSFVTTEDIVILALHSFGGKKKVLPQMQYFIILNKADNEKRKGFAKEICKNLEKHGVKNVIVTAHR